MKEETNTREMLDFQQLRQMGKSDLVRLVQDADEENRKLGSENGKKQSRINELEQGQNYLQKQITARQEQYQQEKRKLSEDNESQREQIGRLEEEIKNLQKHIADLQSELEQVKLVQQDPGSLAESMIQVNGLMEAAQNTADQYLERIREMERTKAVEVERAMSVAQQKADQIVARAKTDEQRIKSEGANVLENLQADISKLLSGARDEYINRDETESTGLTVPTVRPPIQTVHADFEADVKPIEWGRDESDTEADETKLETAENIDADIRAAKEQGSDPTESASEPQAETIDVGTEDDDEYEDGLSFEITRVLNHLTDQANAEAADR